MAKAESGLRAQIARALREQGWHVDSNPASATTGPGRSDFTVCADGYFFALEVKVPGGVVTSAQQRYREKISRARGVWFVAHNPEEAVAEIKLRLSYRRLY